MHFEESKQVLKYFGNIVGKIPREQREIGISEICFKNSYFWVSSN